MGSAGGQVLRAYGCPSCWPLLYQATLILAEICTTLHCAIQPNGVLSEIRKSATEWETNYSAAIKYDSV